VAPIPVPPLYPSAIGTLADEEDLLPPLRAHIAEREARLARRRRAVEARLGVPEGWEGFTAVLRGLFGEAGFPDAPGGLDAARLWYYLEGQVAPPISLDAALDAGFLLGLDASAVGCALDLLRRAELVAGTARGFVTLNPAVPF
jgi:hypothetical protein